MVFNLNMDEQRRQIGALEQKLTSLDNLVSELKFKLSKSEEKLTKTENSYSASVKYFLRRLIKVVLQHWKRNCKQAKKKQKEPKCKASKFLSDSRNAKGKTKI